MNEEQSKPEPIEELRPRTKRFLELLEHNLMRVHLREELRKSRERSRRRLLKDLDSRRN